MAAIKRTFDPENLLNPGKVVPLKTETEARRTSPTAQLSSRRKFSR